MKQRTDVGTAVSNPKTWIGLRENLKKFSDVIDLGGTVIFRYQELSGELQYRENPITVLTVA